jgi:hypothetical protein
MLRGIEGRKDWAQRSELTFLVAKIGEVRSENEKCEARLDFSTYSSLINYRI